MSDEMNAVQESVEIVDEMNMVEDATYPPQAGFQNGLAIEFTGKSPQFGADGSQSGLIVWGKTSDGLSVSNRFSNTIGGRNALSRFLAAAGLPLHDDVLVDSNTGAERPVQVRYASELAGKKAVIDWQQAVNSTTKAPLVYSDNSPVGNIKSVKPVA